MQPWAAFVLRPIGLLELGRAHVAQRRVDPRAVVHHLDVLEDAEHGLVARRVRATRRTVTNTHHLSNLKQATT